jgi:hypothetical protein
MFKSKKKKSMVQEPCVDCKYTAEYPLPSKDCFRQQYEITILLGEKFYNVPLELFLFPNPNKEEVIVSETNEVSFITDDTWYIQNLINKDGILKVSVIKQLQ